jgi:hypothetical protein
MTLVRNIESADEVSIDLIPIELVEVFDKYYSPKVGALLIGLKRKGLKFDFPIISVNKYEEAFRMVKTCETEEEKVIYTLLFLGLFNKAAFEGVNKFINLLHGNGA